MWLSWASNVLQWHTMESIPLEKAQQANEGLSVLAIDSQFTENISIYKALFPLPLYISWICPIYCTQSFIHTFFFACFLPLGKKDASPKGASCCIIDVIVRQVSAEQWKAKHPKSLCHKTLGRVSTFLSFGFFFAPAHIISLSQQPSPFLSPRHPPHPHQPWGRRSGGGRKWDGQLLGWCETSAATPSSCLTNVPWASGFKHTYTHRQTQTHTHKSTYTH